MIRRKLFINFCTSRDNLYLSHCQLIPPVYARGLMLPHYATATDPPLPPLPATPLRTPSALNRAYRDPFLLPPLLGTLLNPLFSHAAEAAPLTTCANMCDAQLSAAARGRLSEMLSLLPPELFGARFVRPVREALDRAFRSHRAGGDASLRDVISLTRLLKLGHVANQAVREGGGVGGGSGEGGGGGGGAEARGVHPFEFYCSFISEHLDALQDYLNYARFGPLEPGA